MRRIIVDAGRCAGCRYCEMVCSYAHEGRFSPSLSRVTVIKEDAQGMDYPVYCRQCEECPSITACPAEALHRTREGFIAVDADACIGCGSCATACKFDAVKMGSSSKPIICDLCGGAPRCVEKCPTQALSFEESGEFQETPVEAFARLREEWGIDG